MRRAELGQGALRNRGGAGLGQRALRNRKGAGCEGSSGLGAPAMSAPQRKGRARRRGWGEAAAALNPRQGRSFKDVAAPPRSRSAAGPAVLARPWSRVPAGCAMPPRPGVAVRHWTLMASARSLSQGTTGLLVPESHRATGLVRIATSEVKIRQK